MPIVVGGIPTHVLSSNANRRFLLAGSLFWTGSTQNSQYSLLSMAKSSGAWVVEQGYVYRIAMYIFEIYFRITHPLCGRTPLTPRILLFVSSMCIVPRRVSKRFGVVTTTWTREDFEMSCSMTFIRNTYEQDHKSTYLYCSISMIRSHVLNLIEITRRIVVCNEDLSLSNFSLHPIMRCD